MYGTSLDSIKEVLDNGKICVIDLEPHVSVIMFIKTKLLMFLSLVRLKTVIHMLTSLYSSAFIQSETRS